MKHSSRHKLNISKLLALLKALVWFWLIDETISANLVYQSDYEIGGTTPSDEEIMKIMMMVMIKRLDLKRRKRKK